MSRIFCKIIVEVSYPDEATDKYLDAACSEWESLDPADYVEDKIINLLSSREIFEGFHVNAYES